LKIKRNYNEESKDYLELGAVLPWFTNDSKRKKCSREEEIKEKKT